MIIGKGTPYHRTPKPHSRQGNTHRVYAGVIPGEAKHYETRKSGCRAQQQTPSLPIFPEIPFWTLKFFRKNKNRILPPWVMSSLPSCRNLLAYHSYSKIFPGNETGDIPHGCCIYGMDVLYLRQSYFLSVVILVLLFLISISQGGCNAHPILFATIIVPMIAWTCFS